MKQLLNLATGGLLLLAFATPSHAQSFGVQFPGYYSNEYANLNNPNNLTAGVSVQQNWNVAQPFTNAGFGTGAGTISNGDLIDGGGLPAPDNSLVDTAGNEIQSVTFALNGATDSRGENAASGFPSPHWYAPGGLSDQYLAGNGFYTHSDPITLNLTGLNNGDGYDVIEYVMSPDYAGDRDFSASLNGTTYKGMTDNSGDLTYYVGTTSTSAYVTADYVEFFNVEGSVLNSDAVTLSGPSGYVGLNGFQVVDLGAYVVPEPSTYLMMGAGLLALLVIRKRKLSV